MSLLETIPSPVLVAPMAGGPITTELIVAAEEAGSFAFLPLGRVSPVRARELMAELDEHTFGVNLFYPQDPISPEAEQFARALAESWGSAYPEVDYSFDFANLVDEVLAAPTPPKVFSTMFGCPETQLIETLHERGIEVWATVTSVEEAITASGRGVDALVIQAHTAGGHRGTWEVDTEPNTVTLAELVSSCYDALGEKVPPLIAAGGIRNAADVRAALSLPGTVKVSCGSAFLLADEAGTSTINRHLITSANTSVEPTVATRAFTGRIARGLSTPFTRVNPDLPGAYPQLNALLAPKRPSESNNYNEDYAYCLVGVQPHRISGGSVAEILHRLNK